MSRFPPKKILVPVDLSDAALAGWKQAESVAGQLGAKVEGLFVREWLPIGFGLREVDIYAEQSERYLKDIRKRLAPGAAIRTVPGVAADTIHTWAELNGFDLIVMGTHSRSAVGRAILGSVAEGVMRSSRVPVLVARAPARKIRSILAPVNEQPYALDGLLAAARLAAALGATVTVFHAIDSPVFGGPGDIQGVKATVEKLISRLPSRLQHETRPHVELGFGNPAREIAAASRGHQLVVIAAHPKGFLNDLTLGTTAERVMRLAPCPVLAVPTARVPGREKSQAARGRGKAAA